MAFGPNESAFSSMSWPATAATQVTTRLSCKHKRRLQLGSPLSGGPCQWVFFIPQPLTPQLSLYEGATEGCAATDGIFVRGAGVNDTKAN